MLQYAPNRRPLEPLPACKRHIRSRGCRCMRAQGNVKELFEFLFGASGRINRAKYWRSVLIYIGAGLMTAVILFTAAGIAAPLFVIAIVVVLLPWLLWGFSFTTERLHDRDKSAWWLVVFYGLPAALTQLAKLTWIAGTTGAVMQTIPALAAF